MLSYPEPRSPRPARAETRRFARRLLLAMGALAALATFAAVLVARAQLAAAQATETELRFATAFAGQQALQSLRAELLAERARVLATRPRLHAALEDDALDLLYLAARDDLRETLIDPTSPGENRPTLRARFYRFADAAGQIVPPPASIDTGPATPAELTAAASLAAHARERVALSWEKSGHPDRLTELLAQPLFSNSDGRRIGVLVLGFDDTVASSPIAGAGFPGRWTASGLHAPSLPAERRQEAELALAPALAAAPDFGDVVVQLRDADWMVLHRLDPSTATHSDARALWFAPLADLARRQRDATWRILGVGGLLALGAVVIATGFSVGFGGWFGRLASAEERQRERRAEAETRLARTAAELERSARYSADASHQLKTPVAVLRLGIDELAADPALPPARLPDIEELRRQTVRLGDIIDDLLLLARLDAGLLRRPAEIVDIAALAAAAMDDVSAMPEGENLKLELDLPDHLIVLGDRGLLGLVLQNLTENAAKYNRPGGQVRLHAEPSADAIRLHVSNTAPHPVPPEARELIFERFHRGPSGATTPGHGLGLNLARELARLHGGELILARSDAELTVFTLSLPRLQDHGENGSVSADASG